MEDNLSKAKVAIQIQEKFIIYLNKTTLNKKIIYLMKFCRKQTKIKDALCLTISVFCFHLMNKN